MRISRRIPLGNKVKLELIAEAFNLLNTTNITSARDTLYNFTTVAGVPTVVPQLNLSNPRLNFGADSNALNGFDPNSRIVQIAAKVTF